MNTLPAKLTDAILTDAAQRDRVTARRAALLETLWRERNLTREQLIARIETQLGAGCFGAKTWQENFYRDMRFVRSAFARAGHTLKYSRRKGASGYYLDGEENLHPDEQTAIRGALNELDSDQLDIIRRLSPTQKFAQAASMINFGRRVQRTTHDL